MKDAATSNLRLLLRWVNSQLCQVCWCRQFLILPWRSSPSSPKCLSTRCADVESKIKLIEAKLAALSRAQVLAVAARHSPGPRRPLDEGGAWDADTQIYADGEWTTVTLTLTGPWEWGEALVERFTPTD